MPRKAKKLGAGLAHRKARLYHFGERTIQQIEVLAALYGGKEKAIAGAIDATYRAAGEALKKMKVKAPRGLS